MKTLLISSLLSATLAYCVFQNAPDAATPIIVVYFFVWTLILCFPVAFVRWLIRKGY